VKSCSLVGEVVRSTSSYLGRSGATSSHVFSLSLFLSFFLSSYFSSYLFNNNDNNNNKYRLVDESPRWLYVKGRYAEAHAIVCKQLIKNGKDVLIPEGGFTSQQLHSALGSGEAISRSISNQRGGEAAHQAEDVSYGIVDLFKTPRLRNRTFNISLNW
jgi:hypothetical protein